LLGEYKLLYEEKYLEINPTAYKREIREFFRLPLATSFIYILLYEIYVFKGGGLNENDPNLSFDDNYF
jgi:hypothetical protein